MNAAQAAEHLGVDVKTLRRWRESESLPYSKVGSRVFYRRGRLDDWLAQHEPAPSAPADIQRRRGRRHG